MAKRIYYKDVDRKNYESYYSEVDEINDSLKDRKLVSVETLKKVIRFWYIVE
jgi:hypothetical protein